MGSTINEDIHHNYVGLMKPFRWNLKKKEQLGRLLEGERVAVSSWFFDELHDVALKVAAVCSDSDMVFVGRSPESIYDYLTGVFEATSHEERLTHLNMSNRFESVNQIKGEMPFNYDGLKAHFRESGLSPCDIVHHNTGMSFVDLVYSGGTYEQLFFFLKDWCKEDREDFNALKRKIRFVGITSRTKNSPNTWRWQQHASWLKENSDVSVINISISRHLWDYLGNTQEKVEEGNPPEKWADESILLPPRDESNLKALRLAYDIYSLGRVNRSSFMKGLPSP